MRILTINPGSTSTKVVLFAGGQVVREVEIQHAKDELAAFAKVIDQLEYRLAAVRLALSAAAAGLGHAGGDGLGALDAVVGRGGLLSPLPGGTYAVDEAMLADLRNAPHGEHSSNLGAFMALEFAGAHGCPAYVVDPIVTDEMDPVARVTGLPGVERRSIFHALSQRGAAREAARRLGVRYEDENFIVAHLGGGISIGAHRRGRVADVVNALDGEGPFSPERSGGIPAQTLITLIGNGAYTPEALRRAVTTQAGLYALLGTNDLRQVEAKMEGGDERAALVFSALAYNVAKHIASLTPVFAGTEGCTGADGTPCGVKDASAARSAVSARADVRTGDAAGSGGGCALPLRAVVLTGGMARSARLVAAIAGRIGFLAPVLVVTGLEEMATMAAGAERALAGIPPVLHYRP